MKSERRTSVWCAAVLAAAASVNAAPPANNDCVNAQHIGAGGYVVSTVGASNDGPLASCGRAFQGVLRNQYDVWYSYTAGVTGTAIFKTENCLFSGFSFGLYLTILDGCQGGEQLCHNICDSSVTYPITQGQTYLLRIASSASPRGTIPNESTTTFIIDEAGTNANETCATAQVVTPGVYPFNTYGATTDGSAACDTTVADLYYDFTAPFDATWEFSGVDAAFVPILTIKSDCEGADLACASAGTGTQHGSRVSRFMETGERVVIRVAVPDSFTDYLSGYLTILGNITPAYDTCGGALNVGLGTTNFDTTGCFVDAPSSCGGVMDAFFKFTPAHTGSYRFDTCGSLFDTVMSASLSCGGAELACSDNQDIVAPCLPYGTLRSAFDLDLTGGVPIYLRIAGPGQGQEHGAGKLNITQLTVPCPADFNGDNVRDVADLFGYINAWLAKTANADFNHDSVVDVADLFGFINAWLAGC